MFQDDSMEKEYRKYMDRAVIFDLDGTLWDSREEICKIWNRVFEASPETDYQMSLLDIERLMGKTMEEIGEILFPVQGEDFQKKIMDQCGAAEVVYLREHGALPYDGVRETVDRLKDSYDLYIVSNCQDGYIEAFMEAHGYMGDFDDIEMSGRTGKGKGENIRLLMERNHISKAVYVGDTVGDEKAARQAGIPFIYAAYGFGRAIRPDCIIQEIRDLPEALDQLME